LVEHLASILSNNVMNDSLESAKEAIEDAYIAMTPKSAALGKQARHVLPSGVVHDSRFIKPHGLYASHAAGSRKWDVDGNQYIDYYGGHGALLLGHNHPELVAAANAQLLKGTHFATNHEMEIRWAEKIIEMVPSAERVRFHSSGTEATQMAVRLARAYTGKRKIMRFQGHYHGWLDDMTTGYISHFDGTPVIGVPESTANNSITLDPYNESEVEKYLVEDNDIAAVIVEPLGAATGKVPISPEFLQSLRRWTKDNNVLLIFDEVVTGFRVSPGGVQEAVNVMPDLTALAKIVAGGLPGAAVTGSADIVDGLDHDAAKRSGREKISHPGTFNACPVSAAAGIQALNIIQQTDVCETANRLAKKLRVGLSEVVKAHDVPWVVYGEASAFHIYMQDDKSPEHDERFSPVKLGREELARQPVGVAALLRLALNINGVDFTGWPGGLVSAAHSDVDIEDTIEAFSGALNRLKPIVCV
jgi:glutamate-1-semialdehyde 2,1-aminomutase